jgi:hypothetical protein
LFQPTFELVNSSQNEGGFEMITRKAIRGGGDSGFTLFKTKVLAISRVSDATQARQLQSLCVDRAFGTAFFVSGAFQPVRSGSSILKFGAMKKPGQKLIEEVSCETAIGNRIRVTRTRTRRNLSRG